jgi:hypothetical protein
MTTSLSKRLTGVPIAQMASVVLLVGGCSRADSAPPAGTASAESGARPSTAAPKTYECDSLIPVQQMDRLAGVTGTKRSTLKRSKEEEEMYQGVTYCEYYLSESLTLTFIMYDQRGSGGDESPFSFAWGRAKREDGEPVSGVGDAALLERNTVAGTVLLTQAKGRGIIARIGDVSEGGSKLDKPDVLKRVTTTIVGRL